MYECQNELKIFVVMEISYPVENNTFLFLPLGKMTLENSDVFFWDMRSKRNMKKNIEMKILNGLLMKIQNR